MDKSLIGVIDAIEKGAGLLTIEKVGHYVNDDGILCFEVYDTTITVHNLVLWGCGWVLHYEHFYLNMCDYGTKWRVKGDKSISDDDLLDAYREKEGF